MSLLGAGEEGVSLTAVAAGSVDGGLSALGSLAAAAGAFESAGEEVDADCSKFSPGAAPEAGCMLSLRDTGSTGSTGGACGEVVVVIISGLRSGVTDDCVELSVATVVGVELVLSAAVDESTGTSELEIDLGSSDTFAGWAGASGAAEVVLVGDSTELPGVAKSWASAALSGVGLDSVAGALVASVGTGVTSELAEDALAASVG